MRAVVPAVSAVAFVLIGLGIFIGGRQAAPEPELQAPAEAGPPVPEAPAGDVLQPPGRSPETSRLIAPSVVAPPQLDTGKLERTAPRAPLGELSKPLPPGKEEKGGMLFRPLAVESAVVEAMGRKVTIAGTESLPAGETCEFEGAPWPCGMRARTAFRMWLRGRALDCDLPAEAGDEVTASCSWAGGTPEPGSSPTAGPAPLPEVATPGPKRKRGLPARAFSARRPIPRACPQAARRRSRLPLRRQLTRQCPLNEGARVVDPVKGGERAEARAALLADQHLIDHLEEGDGYAGAAFGRLPGMILIALDPPRDVKRRILDRLAVRICRPARRAPPTVSAALRRSTASGAR